MKDYRYYELTYSLEGIDEHHFYNSYEAAWISHAVNVIVPKGCRIKLKPAARRKYVQSM